MEKGGSAIEAVPRISSHFRGSMILKAHSFSDTTYRFTVRHAAHFMDVWQVPIEACSRSPSELSTGGDSLPGKGDGDLRLVAMVNPGDPRMQSRKQGMWLQASGCRQGKKAVWCIWIT